uniref:Uncharacterized protein n=1 Tax=Photinus pyralis TaxID=7054 RepID=A0A1Y1K7R1_PHOPY
MSSHQSHYLPLQKSHFREHLLRVHQANSNHEEHADKGRRTGIVRSRSVEADIGPSSRQGVQPRSNRCAQEIAKDPGLPQNGQNAHGIGSPKSSSHRQREQTKKGAAADAVDDGEEDQQAHVCHKRPNCQCAHATEQERNIEAVEWSEECIGRIPGKHATKRGCEIPYREGNDGG